MLTCLVAENDDNNDAEEADADEADADEAEADADAEDKVCI